MSEQWQKVENAVKEAIEKTFSGLEAFLRLAAIYGELPPDDQSLLVEMLIDWNYDKQMGSLDKLIDKAAEACIELMREIRRVAEEKGKGYSFQ